MVSVRLESTQCIETFGNAFHFPIQQGLAAPWSAPWCGCMCGNACLCGSGRTAAFVKMILSPRQTMTNGDQTAGFAEFRLDCKNHRRAVPDARCQTVYPNPLACSRGFHPPHLQRLGRRYEKNSTGPGCTCSATGTSVQSSKSYSGSDPLTVFLSWTASPSLGKNPPHLMDCLV